MPTLICRECPKAVGYTHRGNAELNARIHRIKTDHRVDVVDKSRAEVEREARGEAEMPPPVEVTGNVNVVHGADASEEPESEAAADVSSDVS